MRTKIILGLIVLSGLFFNLVFRDRAPMCFNADEAAFSYNAYSIFKTGRDEYGAFMPLRLKSFGDYKMPLLSYFTAPFVGILGLNETTTRLPNTVIAVLLPLCIFFLTKELFERDNMALLSAFLVTACLGLNIVGRHLHEAYITVFLLSMSFLFYVRLLKKFSWKNGILFLAFLFLSLFSYHFSRIFAGGFFMYSLYHFWPQKKQGRSFLAAFVFILVLFAITDVIYKPERVKNLLYFNNPGYVKRIQELREEGGPRVFYNKVMPGIKEVVSTSMTYFSPQFLVINGDENPRFGFPSMSTITMIEFVFFFVGLYFLFKNKERFRGIIILLLLLTPLAASLSWAGLSLTRTLFIFVPIAILGSYGFFHSIDVLKNKNLRLAGIFLAVFVYAGLLYYQWDFYLLHYPRRALVVRAWQCGYKEMTAYVKKNYGKYDRFYISKLNGQPYIFMLFYLNYPPDKYQKVAKLSPPDQYGFGQVEAFDKFTFNFVMPKKGSKENVLLVGYPTDDFKSQATPVPNLDSVVEIRKETETMFWMYDNAKLNH